MTRAVLAMVVKISKGPSWGGRFHGWDSSTVFNLKRASHSMVHEKMVRPDKLV